MTRELAIEKAKPTFSFDHDPYDAQIARDWFRIGAEWADSHPINPWRSVKEELPKENTWVFTCSDDDGVPISIGVSKWNGEEWYDDEPEDLCVDYWFPIPDLPKEKEEQK